MDTETTILKLRASAMPRWMACPARAAHEALTPQNADEIIFGEPVATVFGSMVHAEITGHEFEWPKAIKFDLTTKTEKELRRQVDTAVRNLQMHLGPLKFERREVELQKTVHFAHFNVTLSLTGHLDFMAWRGLDSLEIFDLKTGVRKPSSSWSQLAVYCWLADKHGFEFNRGVLLWAPRGTRTLRELSATRHQLVNAGTRMIASVASNAAYGTPIPGDHCEKCTNSGCAFYP